MAFDSQSIPIDATVAMFTITPGKQDFGPLTVGQTSAPVIFTITNKGDLPSDTPNVATTGDFSVSSNNCGPLPANASCMVGVVFKPAATGARAGVLDVTSSDGNTFSATLAGTGVAPTPGQFRLTPMANNYGYRQMKRVSGDLIFTLSNTGQQPTAIPALSIGGADSKEFAFNPTAPPSSYCPNPLQPGGSCTIPVHFAPQTVGTSTNGLLAKSATLDVGGTPGGPVSAALSGVATQAENGLEFDPPHVDLRLVDVGKSATATFTLRNIAAAPIRITAITVINNQRVLEWTVNSANCPPTLEPQTSCPVVVTFTHQTPVGLRETSLQAAGANGNFAAKAASHVQATAQ
jgi:hypothetical protein